MQYAESYQDCSPPDDEGRDNSLIVAIAEWIHDGDTADDVRIDAERIAYRINAQNGHVISARDVRELAEDAVYFSRHGRHA